MTFGAKVKALRTKAGLSQPQLAAKAGVSTISIRHYEQGIREVPSWPAVLKLSRALGVSCEVFAGCDEGKR